MLSWKGVLEMTCKPVNVFDKTNYLWPKGMSVWFLEIFVSLSLTIIYSISNHSYLFFSLLQFCHLILKDLFECFLLESPILLSFHFSFNCSLPLSFHLPLHLFFCCSLRCFFLKVTKKTLTTGWHPDIVMILTDTITGLMFKALATITHCVMLYADFSLLRKLVKG